jgi:CRISPR/Cas system-associated endonuclease Cas3-HD
MARGWLVAVMVALGCRASGQSERASAFVHVIMSSMCCVAELHRCRCDRERYLRRLSEAVK